MVFIFIHFCQAQKGKNYSIYKKTVSTTKEKIIKLTLKPESAHEHISETHYYR